MLFLTNPHARRLSLLGVAAALALTACQGQPEHFNELEAEEPKAEHITQLESWLFPTDEAEQARRGFVQRCVEASGGHYTEPAPELSLETAVFTGRTTEQLRNFGYGPLPATSDQLMADYDPEGLTAYLGEGGETFEVTFMDYSTGPLDSSGCMVQSYEYIYGTAESGLRTALLAPQFAQAITDELRQDEEYTALQSNWASCMAEAGFDSASSTDQATYTSTLLEADRHEEMLESDISCRLEHNFDQRVTELKNAYYEAVYERLKQHSGEIEQVHTTATERVEADRANPHSSSPVTVPTPTASPSDSSPSAASSSGS